MIQPDARHPETEQDLNNPKCVQLDTIVDPDDYLGLAMQGYLPFEDDSSTKAGDALIES